QEPGDLSFPSCHDEGYPETLFDLAKTVFSENIVDAVGEFSHFALQRFPQHERTGLIPDCIYGYYIPSTDDTITGDDGSMDTTTGSWFSAHRDEAIVVPFSVGLGLENTDALLRWLDFDEELVSTTQTCTEHSECPKGGCDVNSRSGPPRCLVHSQPELRMGGATPLGKSLFYAGEYFRTSVLIDGQACDDDGDCRSSGYACDGGACRDPYAHCRDNFIVLFTDGEETLFTDKHAFFGPQAQAKRLAFGLHCEVDADCRGGATCVVEGGLGSCEPPGGSSVDPPSVPGTGFDALTRPDGSGISIRTTVVNVRSPGAVFGNPNALIAWWGGGALVDVYSDDPETMKAQLYDVMTPAFKCDPEEL
ncbi:MAG: hypothetical protein QF464_21025, partial [Myxococcota bacterium]|nr:hypothetical protein [Myxococcota bacterium]